MGRNTRIADNVQAARERAGLGIGELADVLRLSAARLEALEAGSGLDSVLLFDLSRALGVSPDALLHDGPPFRLTAPEWSDPHVRWGIKTLEEIAAAERLVARYRL